MAGRTFGDLFTRKVHRREGSSVFAGATPVPLPPVQPFVAASDRRGPYRTDASSAFPAQQLNAVFMLHWVPTPEKYQSVYRPHINYLRGNAGPAGAAPAAEPSQPFLTASPRIRGVAVPDASQILRPYALVAPEYDPEAGGAFINTPSPWRSWVLPYRQDSFVYPPPAIFPTLPVEAQPFIRQSLFYRSNYQKDNSWTTQAPGANIILSMVRFWETALSHNPRGASYRDVSGSGTFLGIFGPPNLIPQPSGTTLYDIYHYYANHS